MSAKHPRNASGLGWPGRLWLAFLALLPACGADSTPTRPPDVLLISLDTLRADRLSCYGYERPTTPRIDALSAEGVRCAEAQAPSVITAPSHMSMLTGLDPVAHGVANSHHASTSVSVLSEAVPTMPELLRSAGYRTAAFTDSGNLQTAMGFARGFEHYHSLQEALPRKVIALRRYLKQAPADEPLFVFFHTYATHAPYIPAANDRGTYTDPDYDGLYRRRFQALLAAEEATGALRHNKHARRFLEDSENAGPEDLRFLSDLYDETVTSTDRRIGGLWDIWSGLRDPENTLLVIVSDHGEAFGEHGLVGHRGEPHRELVSVPLILRGPGLEPRVVDQPVSLTGLLSTVLDFLELPHDAQQQPSFLELLRGKGDPTPSALHNQRTRTELAESSLSVLDQGLHLLVTHDGDEPALELYDWHSDPLEAQNLAAERADDARRLQGLLQERWREGLRRRELRPPLVGGQPEPSVLAELEALGYTGED